MHRFKKCLVLFLILTLITFVSYQPVSAQVPKDKLSEVEEIIFGESRDGAIIERIEKLEQTLYNTTNSGSLMERTDQIVGDVLVEGEDPSMVFILNALEWSLTSEINQGTISERLSSLEKAVFGEAREGGLVDRLKKLGDLSLPDGELPAEKVVIPEDQLVRIRTLEQVSSVDSSEGQEVPFEVVNDVRVEDKLVIAAGSRGTMEISKIEKAGKMGQDAQLELEFYDLKTIDGHSIKLKMDEEAREENRSQKLAIGASLLATALLGPVGLVAGFFVEGKEEAISEGAELYAQTDSQTTVYGLSMK